MNNCIKLIMLSCCLLSMVAAYAKAPVLAIRNETRRNIAVKYVLYLPQWKKLSVTVRPSESIILGNATQLTIHSVYAKRKVGNFWRKLPEINERSLKRALKNAREFAQSKQSATIVFYQILHGKEIFSFAEPEFTRKRQPTMIGMPVEKMSR